MRVFARFLIVIILLVGSFLALLLATEMFQRRQSSAVLARASERREAALSTAFGAASIPLQAFVEGLRTSLREGSVGTGENYDGQFQIGGSPAALLIEGPQGASEFRADEKFPAALTSAMREAAVAPDLEGKTAVFFISDGSHVAEYRRGWMDIGDDRVRFAVARLWGDTVLSRIAAQSAASVTVLFESATNEGDEQTAPRLHTSIEGGE